MGRKVPRAALRGWRRFALPWAFMLLPLWGGDSAPHNEWLP